MNLHNKKIPINYTKVFLIFGLVATMLLGNGCSGSAISNTTGSKNIEATVTPTLTLTPTPTKEITVTPAPITPTAITPTAITPTATPTVEATSIPTVESKQNNNQNTTVYITKTGKKYHRNGCRYLSRSKVPLNLNEAKNEGYEPCSICNPPQ